MELLSCSFSMSLVQSLVLLLLSFSLQLLVVILLLRVLLMSGVAVFFVLALVLVVAAVGVEGWLIKLITLSRRRDHDLAVVVVLGITGIVLILLHVEAPDASGR